MFEPFAKRVKVEENVFSDVKDSEDIRITANINYMIDKEYIELLNLFKNKKTIIETEFNQWCLYHENHFKYLNIINNKLFELEDLQMNYLSNDLYFKIIMKEENFNQKFTYFNNRLIKIDKVLKWFKFIKEKFDTELLKKSKKYPSLSLIIKTFN